MIQPVSSVRRISLGRLVLIAVPIGFLGYFFLYPLASILGVSLFGEGGFSFDAFSSVATRGSLRGAIWFTVWQAVASTLLTLIIAMPAAYVFARFSFPGKRFFRAAITVPFVLPTVVVGAAYLALLGPNGPLGIDLRQTIWAILIAHVFYNYAVVVRTVGGLWAHLDPRLEEAARMLGASRWRTFREVSLPLLRPAIAAAASMVFLFTFTSFGVVLILGGFRFTTIEVEIWRQTTTFLDLPVAGALAVLQLVGISAILVAYSRYQERRSIEQHLRPVTEVARAPRGRREAALVWGVLGFTGLFLGAPLAVLVTRSFRVGDGYGFDAYRSLAEASVTLVPPIEAIGNSTVFAAGAMAIAIVIGTMAATVIAYHRGAVSRWFDVLLMLPLGTSAVTIGFGFLVALDTPIDLRTAPILVPIAHALVAIPFVVRTEVPVMRSVRTRLREAGAMLGAPPARVWREIDLPLIFRAMLVGAGFAFAISLGEFGATSFIARPDAPTLPVAIFRLLSRAGAANFTQAMALSTVLMGLTAVSILAIERFRIGEMGEF
jgi:thiamine transport system permease protein